MADSKTKNSSRNLVFGICLKVYQLLVPFLIRTIIIRVSGIEYAGLNSLFTSILQVLNIAELGVGTALVFSMYKPIAEHDDKKICALMQLYKIYYRVIGLVILAIGLCITPFLSKLIKGDVPPDINIYVLYFLNLGATVLSYWLFAYKNSLFQAHQRNDVVSKVTILTNTVMYVLQISLLCIYKNYYFYVIIMLFAQVLNNILVAAQANKYYPHYKAKGKLDKEETHKINASIKDLFYSQLGLVITTSVDSIVISAFLGLVPLAIYQNYYYILNALIAFFTIFYQSCRASIGTNLIVKSKEDNFKDYQFITFIVMGVLSFCVSCLLCLYQPFIELWVGKENMLDDICVVLFGVYFFVYELARLIGCYKDVSGKWHADRFRPLITAIVNLVSNIIMVQYIGIYGILLSTIFSFLLVNIPWLYKRVFIDIFEIEEKKIYSQYIGYKVLVFFIIVSMNSALCRMIHLPYNYLQLIINLLICTVLTGVFYSLANSKDKNFIRLIRIARRFLGSDTNNSK